MGGSYLCAQDDPAVPQEEEPSVATAAAATAQPPVSVPESEDSGWRISPEKINIQMGQDRVLQALDDEAQELHGGTWAVNNPDLAEIREEDGHVVLHPKAVGTVIVTATIGQETRSRQIKVWSALRRIPLGTTTWSLHPIGREIGDIPAVPTADGPMVYSLEQTAAGKTFLRADAEGGVQVWVWQMPEDAHDVELVCGDWMGGALISANRADSFTLYTVGKDGTTSWKHTFAGVRKGHAYNLEHVVHILSQSVDGMTSTLTALDEVTGKVRFAFNLPASHEIQKNIKREGQQVVCASGLTTNPQRTIASRLMVSMDGFAYVAFTQNEWTLDGGKCAPGTALDPHTLTLTRDEKLLLWQVHPDGTYRSFVVEANKMKQPLSAPSSVASPTGAVVTDNMNGTLVSVRLSHTVMPENTIDPSDELIYRLNEEGEVVYKFPLPKYSGPLQDEMVIGSNELAFATRGGKLIAFDQTEGKELWQWESNAETISVVAALADGSCLVQTPTEAVIVSSPTKSKVYMTGKVMLGWHGEVFRKHQ
jgi:outer membrane protein assembly factor BamB